MGRTLGALALLQATLPVDSGVTAGDSVSGAFDSLLGKLIVTGRDRAEALERSRRALDEFEVAGLPTVLPFHRKVVREPAFIAAPRPPAAHAVIKLRPPPRRRSSWRLCIIMRPPVAAKG